MNGFSLNRKNLIFFLDLLSSDIDLNQYLEF